MVLPNPKPSLAMNWILVASLLALAYLTSIAGRFSDSRPLQSAWQWFALVLTSRFVFALLRVGNLRDAHDLALVEIWSDGIEALLLGFSIFSLARLIPAGGPRSDQPPPPPVS